MNKNIFGIAAALLIMVAVVFGAVKFNPDLTPTPVPTPINPVDPVDPVDPVGPVDPNSANVVIKAPESVQAGELVQISVAESNADSFSWKIEPHTKNFQVVDGGRRAFFSHGSSGEFLIIVAGAKGGTSDVKTIRIKIIGPDVPPNPTDIASKVPSWCEKVQSPTKRDDALKLAQSFSSVAAVIKPTMTPGEVVEATKKSNQDALGANVKHWEPFLIALQTELKAQATAGTLSDTESHTKAWRAIAEGLNRYAATL